MTTFNIDYNNTELLDQELTIEQLETVAGGLADPDIELEGNQTTRIKKGTDMEQGVVVNGVPTELQNYFNNFPIWANEGK